MPRQKTVLISGCSSGIGRAASFALKTRGWRVFATARKETDVQELEKLGFESCRLDVASSESIKKAIQFCLERSGGTLYALVNNAGYVLSGAVEDISREALRQQFEVNLFGAHELIKELLPVFRSQGYGRIINMSSISGLVALPFMGPYSASKAALEALSESLRNEVKKENIQICLIEPASVQSKVGDNAQIVFKQYVDLESSHYRQVYEKYAEFIKSHRSKLPSPEVVVKKIIHALESKNPKARYLVTKEAYIQALFRKFVPDYIFDILVQTQTRKILRRY